MAISINMDYYEYLFAELKKHLLEASAYSPTILKKPMSIDPVYPQVVFAEIANSDDSSTLGRREVISVLGYEVDIFSTVKVIDGETVDNLVICRELAGLVAEFMSAHGFRRLSQIPTPTVDTTLYRIVGRYNAKMFNNYNQIL